MSGAECVHFQDYNREVLNCMTIPSLLASVKSRWLITNIGEVETVDVICVLVSSAGHGVNGGHGGRGDGEHVQCTLLSVQVKMTYNGTRGVERWNSLMRDTSINRTLSVPNTVPELSNP